jgi:hypothetical protein
LGRRKRYIIALRTGDARIAMHYFAKIFGPPTGGFRRSTWRRNLFPQNALAAAPVNPLFGTIALLFAKVSVAHLGN